MESCSTRSNDGHGVPEDEGHGDSPEAVPSSEDLLTGSRSIRTISWEKAVRLFAMPHGNESKGNGGNGSRVGRPPPLSSGLTPGVKFVHRVPTLLRHVGCMWLEEGDEKRRCGKPVAWTMGADLRLARFYCEDHGWTIQTRRRRTSNKRRGREARAEREKVHQ